MAGRDDTRSGEYRQPYEPEAWDLAPSGGFRSQDRSSQGSGRWQGPGEMRGGPGARGGSFDGYDRGEPARQRATGGGYGEYNYRDEDSPRGGSTGGYGQGSSGQGGFGPGRMGQRSEPSWRPGESSRGQFAGKGPKGYKRSDERIREDVSDILERNGELDASEIEVVVAAGEVTLQGEVTHRRDKRLAEDLIEDLPGVKDVHNRLRVADGSSRKENESSRSRQSGGNKSAGSERSSS